MKHFFRLLLCMFIMLCLQSNVLGADAPKIGVVDIQRLQKRSVVFRKTMGMLQKKRDAMRQKLDKERSELRRLEEDFKKQSMMLSLDAKEDKKRELEKKTRYYKYLREDFSQDVKYEEAEAYKRIVRELEEILKKIGEKRGYTLILDKRTLGLLFYNDAIDITDEVVEAYDRMKK